jgi:hypothetical protein|tara:strand:+ start:605 stop:775 length:171 start_codon:yes stop_codon:yes gene_type:complete
VAEFDGKTREDEKRDLYDPFFFASNLCNSKKKIKKRFTSHLIYYINEIILILRRKK